MTMESSAIFHNFKSARVLLLLVCLLAFALRLWGITFGLPGIDHGDESEVVNHALRFGCGDLNPHRFQYGSLVQYLLFIIYGFYYLAGAVFGRHDSVHQFAVKFVSDPSMFYLMARVVSVCFGTATVWITYMIGRRIKGEDTGLVSALLLAICYQHVIHSHYATVDAAVAFFFAWAVYRSLVLIVDRRITMYLYAGFIAGLAVGTKFNGVMAVVAFAAVHFSIASGAILPRIISRSWMLGVAAAVGGHFIACPYFYLDISTAVNEIRALQTFHAASGFNLWFYLRDLVEDYWGMPAGLLCVASLFRYLITRDIGLRALAIAALCVITFASLHRYVEAKYIICAFSLMAVLGASLLTEVLTLISKGYRAALMMLTLPMLMLHPLYLILQWDAERATKSITLECKEWIEKYIPAGSKLLLDNAGNAGPKLANNPENIKRQYERARAHHLLKADLLKLQLEISPTVSYDIVEIDTSAGSRRDDYMRYRLWQDTDVIGKPAAYYCERGYSYIIVTNRYFPMMDTSFQMIKEFSRGVKGIRIYRVVCEQ